jgi:hypothetical protein
MMGGALRRRVWIDQRWFQWTPNFYIVLVGPPGVVTKSTSAKVGQRILAEVPGVHFGPSSVTWQALVQAFTEAQEHVAMNPTSELDAIETVDQLLGADRMPMACITSVISELGTFLKPQDDDMINVITDLWDGQLGPAWERKTRMHGDEGIENPWLNVIGCTTPSWLKRNFPEHMIHGGLTSRIIWVFADKKRLLNAYPSETVDAKQFEEDAKMLAEDLIQISELRGEYVMSKEALEWGTQWYAEHWAERPIHMASDRFEGYISRKQTHIHKLAIVIAASKREELIITLNDIKHSATMITGLENDMHKVFESIGIVDSSRQLGEMMAYIRAYKEISMLKLWRLCLGTMDRPVFDAAIDAAVKADYITVYSDGGITFAKVKYDKENDE